MTRDSPRWCDHCQSWGDHHSDRCYLADAGAVAREWRDPGKPDLGAGWVDLLLFGVLAIAAVALCIWLATAGDPALDCPDGWRKVTSPSAVQCFNPAYDKPPRPSVQSSPQPRK
jgi:hypothetical protein